MSSDYAVYCGIDVGRSGHHAVALTPAGDRLYDKPLPNDGTRLRTVLDQLADHGTVLIVVDQPNTIGALPVSVARACGHTVALTTLGDILRDRSGDLLPVIICVGIDQRGANTEPGTQKDVGVLVTPSARKRSKTTTRPILNGSDHDREHTPAEIVGINLHHRDLQKTT